MRMCVCVFAQASCLLNKHIKSDNYVETTVDSVLSLLHLQNKSPLPLIDADGSRRPATPIMTITPSGTGAQIRFAVGANPV